MVFDDIELRNFSNQVKHSDLFIVRDKRALVLLDVTTVKGFTFSPKVTLFQPKREFSFPRLLRRC